MTTPTASVSASRHHAQRRPAPGTRGCGPTASHSSMPQRRCTFSARSTSGSPGWRTHWPQRGVRPRRSGCGARAQQHRRHRIMAGGTASGRHRGTGQLPDGRRRDRLRARRQRCGRRGRRRRARAGRGTGAHPGAIGAHRASPSVATSMTIIAAATEAAVDVDGRRRGARVHHVHLGHHRQAQGRGALPPQPHAARVQQHRGQRLARRPGGPVRGAAVPHRGRLRVLHQPRAGRHDRAHPLRGVRPRRDGRPAGARTRVVVLLRACPVGRDRRRARARRPRPLGAAAVLVGCRARVDHPAPGDDRRVPAGRRSSRRSDRPSAARSPASCAARTPSARSARSGGRSSTSRPASWTPR